MARFKNINGVSIQLTAEEETLRDAEEAVNIAAHQAYLERMAQKEADKVAGNQKLLDLGLTQAEVDALTKPKISNFL